MLFTFQKFCYANTAICHLINILYVTAGICSNWLFFTPVAAAVEARREAASCGGVSKPIPQPHLITQRTMEFMPTANINAQSKATN